MKTYQAIEVKQFDEIHCDKCARVARRDGKDYEFPEFVSITPKNYLAISGEIKSLKKNQLGITSLIIQLRHNHSVMIW
jgi:hypothetical protein